MYYSTNKRLLPDIETEWGTYSNPFELTDDDSTFRQSPMPNMIRGSRGHVQYPMKTGQGSAYGEILPSGGVLGTITISLTTALLVLGGFAILGYYFGKKGFPQRGSVASNPCRRNPPQKRRRVSRRTREKMSVRSLSRPRNALGQFIG
jgi:hypothetical protein